MIGEEGTKNDISKKYFSKSTESPKDMLCALIYNYAKFIHLLLIIFFTKRDKIIQLFKGLKKQFTS